MRYEREVTLTDFWHPPAASAKNADERARYDGDVGTGRDYRADTWLGMSLTECRDLPARGWPAGVDAALRLLDAPDVATVGNSRLRRRWSYDDGESIDYERLLDGRPFWCEPFRAPGGIGGRIVRLLVFSGGCADVSARSIAWRVYAAVRYVDTLEAAGYRVEIDTVFNSKRVFTNGKGHRLTVHVKRAEDPVDLSQLAAVLSAGAFRWTCFHWKHAAPYTLSRGYGRSIDVPAVEDGTVYLPETVKTDWQARDWLRTHAE